MSSRREPAAPPFLSRRRLIRCGLTLGDDAEICESIRARAISSPAMARVRSPTIDPATTISSPANNFRAPRGAGSTATGLCEPARDGSIVAANLATAQ